jgi:hypothetical protein
VLVTESGRPERMLRVIATRWLQVHRVVSRRCSTGTAVRTRLPSRSLL